VLRSGINIARFAKRMISYKKINDEAYQSKAASFIVDIARQEGGMLYKFMQYLDTDDRYSGLENKAAENDFAMPNDEVQEIFEQEYKINWNDHFKPLGNQAHLASLSQVHIIESLSGEKFALKMQYPQIKKKIKDQLRLMNFIPKVGGGPLKKWGVDFKSYQEMFENILDHELDYHKEAKAMKDLRSHLPKACDFIIAKPIDDFLSSECFVQEYIDGDEFNIVLQDWSLLDKERVMYNFLKSYINLLVETGYYQGDTNFGNYLFLKENSKIAMLDLGQLQFLKYQKREVLFSFLQKLLNKEDLCYLSYFVALGFDEKKMQHLESHLELLTKVIFEPFIDNQMYDLKNWRYKEKLETLLGENKWWFRSAGDNDFFLLMKSFTGLKSFIQKSNTKLNWHLILKDMISSHIFDFTPPKIKSSHELENRVLSSKLEFIVKRDGKESANISLPINAIFNLEEYMDKEILIKLKSEGVDFNKTVKSALIDGGAPKTLFEIKEVEREVIIRMK